MNDRRRIPSIINPDTCLLIPVVQVSQTAYVFDMQQFKDIGTYTGFQVGTFGSITLV